MTSKESCHTVLDHVYGNYCSAVGDEVWLLCFVLLKNLKFECFLAVHTIKQEEGTEEETERRPNGPDEAGHSGEEGSGLEEPMIDSPNNLQDGGPGTEAQSDAGIRLPNGKYNGKY